MRDAGPGCGPAERPLGTSPVIGTGSGSGPIKRSSGAFLCDTGSHLTMKLQNGCPPCEGELCGATRDKGIGQWEEAAAKRHGTIDALKEFFYCLFSLATLTGNNETALTITHLPANQH